MSKIWKAINVLLGYSMMNPKAMDIKEVQILKNMWKNVDPHKPEEELSFGQIEAVKSMYKRHVVIEGW